MRLIVYVFWPVLGLLGAFLFVSAGIILADPAAVGSPGAAQVVFRSLILFCGGAGIMSLALRMTRTALLERLKVTGDGLISQRAG